VQKKKEKKGEENERKAKGGGRVTSLRNFEHNYWIGFEKTDAFS